MDSTWKMLRRMFLPGVHLDVKGHEFNLSGNNRQIIGSEDREVWFSTHSFTDPVRSLPTMMHISQSRKLQNRGSSTHEHPSAEPGSRVQLSLGAMSHGGMLSRSFQSTGFEPGNRSFSRPTFSNRISSEGSWSAVPSSSPMQRSLTNPLGSSLNSSYTLGSEQGRNPYKRKSTMDLFPDSAPQSMPCGLGDKRFCRFTPVTGSHQSAMSCNSLGDELGLRRDGQGSYQSIRTRAVPASLHDGLNSTVTQDNYYRPSIIQSEGGLRRVMPRSDTINESIGHMVVGQPDTLALRQGNGLSATASWHRSGTYFEESGSQSGYYEPMRLFDTSIDGNGLRQVEAADMIEAASVVPRSHQPPRRTVRPAHFQQFPSASPYFSSHSIPNPYALGTITRHVPSFASVQPSNRYSNVHTVPLLPAPDLPSGSVLGQLPPRYNEASGTSLLRQVSFRGPRPLQLDGINHQRYSSHNDLPNQYLAYEWGDAYDEHSDMRLDVDNMSYEELLALEDRIGNVNTGIEEGNLKNCLKITKHHHSDVMAAAESQESDSKCSVCQEEYVEGDELGELHCGHGYHTDCIKRWLLLKNQCPICKAAAS